MNGTFKNLNIFIPLPGEMMEWVWFFRSGLGAQQVIVWSYIITDV